MKDHSVRTHALLSASSAHRWLACPASAVAAEAYPNEQTEFTREGTLAHEVAEVVAREQLRPETGRDGFAPEVTQEMLDCAAGYRDYIQEQTKSDSAAVLLEQRVDFSPWVPDGFGTCDCIILQDDTMTVIDYKYGQGVPVSAEGNPQLRLYALGALNDYGIAVDVQKVEMHIYQPRINNVSADTITAAELLEWAEKTVKPIAQKAAKGKGGYSAGPHCRFCPHAGRCRELTKTCTEFVETHDLRVAVPVLAPHEVADVLRMLPLISLWAKRVNAQALDTLLGGGTIPGYKVVEGKQGNRQWLDELKVAEALHAAGYKPEDITETKLLSPAAMDKAIGKKRAAELLDALIYRTSGVPTIVPETDKRPAYDPLAEAKKDFE
uniref:PD-(D/E)XK nuclease superfamily protein n=1 Tax=Myoviridae sp. ctRPH1 TaxID=2826650 RepID=A0A8S5MAC0_9CAUD|nr:MAG TPA: PD-(D/E)XK nuclease superfamily protein [Myoviridae sp. ctRPH1]